MHIQSHCLGPHHHLHLECISLALGLSNHLHQSLFLIQPETSREIAHTWSEGEVGQNIRTAGCQLAFPIPAIHTPNQLSRTSVARARDNVGIGLFLDLDEFRDKFRMVREISIHNDDKVPGDKLQAVDISRAETQFARAWLEDNVGCAE